MAQTGSHNPVETRPIRERNVVVNATPQESFGQMFLRVAGQDENRTHGFVGADGDVSQFDNLEVHVFNFVKDVVGKVSWGLIYFINQHNRAPLAAMNKTAGQPLSDGTFLVGAENRCSQRVV